MSGNGRAGTFLPQPPAALPRALRRLAIACYALEERLAAGGELGAELIEFARAKDVVRDLFRQWA